MFNNLGANKEDEEDEGSDDFHGKKKGKDDDEWDELVAKDSDEN